MTRIDENTFRADAEDNMIIADEYEDVKPTRKLNRKFIAGIAAAALVTVTAVIIATRNSDEVAETTED